MYRVTTPTHTYTLPIQTDACKEIQITYKQKGSELVKHYQDGVLPEGMTLDGKDVVIKLTQEETKSFDAWSSLTSQVRVMTDDGSVYASQIFNVVLGDVLNEEILQDEK